VLYQSLKHISDDQFENLKAIMEQHENVKMKNKILCQNSVVKKLDSLG
jgi:hypothetical protein